MEVTDILGLIFFVGEVVIGDLNESFDDEEDNNDVDTTLLTLIGEESLLGVDQQLLLRLPLPPLPKP